MRPGPLIVCDAGSINADRYLEILKDGDVGFVNGLLTPHQYPDSIIFATNDTFLFMHDNAPCHIAIKVKKYLRKQCLSIIKGSAQSPDLNSIENL